MFASSKKFISKKIIMLLSPYNMQAYSLIFLEILVGGMLSILSFLFFVKMAKDVLAQERIFIDTFISHIIYSFRTPALTEVMHFFSFIGGEFVVFASIFVTIVLIVKGYWRDAAGFSFAIFMGYVLNTVIKFFLKVPRPTIDPLYIETFYSFPSGHSMNAFIFYASLSYLVFHFTRKKRLTMSVASISTLLIFCVGFSRVYLGVHYPTDVIAGYIAGFWWFVTVILLDKTLQFYHGLKRKR